MHVRRGGGWLGSLFGAGGVLLLALLFAPDDLIAARGAVLQGLVGAYGETPEISLHVHWTKDFTTSPVETQCSTSGAVGGATRVRIRFQTESPQWSAVVKELRISEGAGHTPDIVVTDLSFTGSASAACGDPAPGTPNTYGLYCDFQWPSTAGHNGSHTVRATIKYAHMANIIPDDQPEAETTTITHEKTVDVQNLIVSAVTPANPEPIVWKPASMSSVLVTAQLKAAYTADHNVSLLVYRSSGGLVASVPASVVVPGGAAGTSVSIPWNGTATGGAAQPKGVYVFKINANCVALTGDSDCDKSSLLSIAQTSTRVVSGGPGTMKTIEVGYRLTDLGTPKRNAAAANARSYDPDILPAAGPVAGGYVANAQVAWPMLWNFAQFQVNVNKSYIYTHLVSAQDSHEAEDKGHRKRWALQHNVEPPYPLAVAYQFNNYPQPGPITTVNYGERAMTLLAKPLFDKTTSYRLAGDATNGAYTNQDVLHAHDNLKKAAIFYSFGHGGGSTYHRLTFYVTFWKNNQWSYLVETTAARDYILANSGGTTPSIVCINDASAPPDAFKTLLLAVFEGCRTASKADKKTGQPIGFPLWGSPARGVVNKGARTAVGFYHPIFSHYTDTNGKFHAGAEEWSEEFWASLCTRGRTVKGAVLDAGEVIRESTGLLTWQIHGDINLKIAPARYNPPPPTP